MSALDLKLVDTVHKYLKKFTEKEIKAAVDKNWLKFHGEISKFNPELKKLKKMDFISYYKIAAKSGFDIFSQLVNAGQIPKGSLTKSEEESLKKGYEAVNAIFNTGGTGMLNELKIGAVEEAVAAPPAPAPAPDIKEPKKKSA
ncbi:MAG: hypothetical protein IPM57_07270 [Oligoflexia bacterium]|nr:hypothetical protein [Oligoflexia bacterium]